MDVRAHLPRMHGKGLARFILLVVTTVLAAGVTLGAMGAPLLMALAQGR
jgi:hypothetical protein